MKKLSKMGSQSEETQIEELTSHDMRSVNKQLELNRHLEELTELEWTQQKQSSLSSMKKGNNQLNQLLGRTIVIKGEGQHFGEVALLEKKPRSCSIICREDVLLATISSEDQIDVLEAQDRQKLQDKIDFFKQVSLFHNSMDEDVAYFTYQFGERSYLNGEQLQKEGEEMTELQLIKSGEVRIERTISIKDKKEEVHKMMEADAAHGV